MLIETTTQKILALLSKWPTRAFSVRELARALKTAHPSVGAAVRELAKRGYVKIGHVGRSSQIKANLEDEGFRHLKRILNLYTLEELTEYLVEKFNHPPAIVVYGSYALGEDVERSDIDITVISKTRVEVDTKLFERELGRGVHIMQFGSWQDTPKDLRASIINGIKLYGTIDIE